MKRSLLGKTIKQTFLVVPAAALMLGVSQAGTTVGLNFQAWYYDSGNTPQTIGFNNGYSDYATTGLPVTATAFGVEVANWYNTDPIGPNSSIANQACTFGGTATAFAGGLSCSVTSPDGTYFSGAGCIPPLTDSTDDGGAGYPSYAPGIWCPPGDDEVLWGEIFGDATNTFSVSVSGLAAKFPNGYVIQSMSALGAVHQSSTELSSLPGVYFTDGTTTNAASYHLWYIQNGPGVQWPITTAGISDPSGVFTADTLYIDAQAGDVNENSALAGFIITDEPVVSQPPASSTNYTGFPLILSAGAIGIPPLSYQWQLKNVSLPGATSPSFTNASLTLTNAGNYTLVVNNLYGSATSEVATVTVEQAPPSFATNLLATTNFVYSGFFQTLTVAVSGSQPLSYQWQLNGAPIAGATNTSLIVSNLTAGISGYSVAVGNSLGTTNSATNYMNVVAAPAGAYTQQVGQDSPDSYWPLNETSGPIAYDYAGLSHNGIFNGGITQGVPGPQSPALTGFSAGNTAYEFDGSSGYVDCGTNASLSGTIDFSVEAWIKTTSTSQGMIVSQRDTNAYNGEYMFTMNAGGTLGITIYGPGGYQFDGLSSTATVNDGNWHYVAFVRSGTTGTLYADGGAVASTNAAVESLNPSIATYIGVDQRGATSYFGGEIASVGIYNYALSAAQIQARATTGGIVPSVSIVDGVIGGLILDTKPVGTPYNGKSVGTTWLASSGPDYNGVTFDGVEQFVETNDSQITVAPETAFDTTSGTISFWMLYNLPTPLPGPGTGAAMLFDRRTTAGVVLTLNTSGSIQFQQVNADTGDYATTTIGSAYVGDGNWHQVTFTYDQSTNGVDSIYVDGVLDTSSVNSGPWSWPTNQEVELGRSHDTYWYLYNGQMTDFRIYNQILTPAQISDMAAPATSGDLEDTNALVLRFSFANNSALFGESVVWPYGTLLSSPALGPGAVWSPVTNAASPLLLMPTEPSQFYRARLP